MITAIFCSVFLSLNAELLSCGNDADGQPIVTDGPFPVEGVHLIEAQILLFELVLQHILFRSLVEQDPLVPTPMVKSHLHLLPKNPFNMKF